MRTLFITAVIVLSFFRSNVANAEDSIDLYAGCKYIVFDTTETYYLYEDGSVIPIEEGKFKNLSSKHGTVCNIAKKSCAVTHDSGLSIDSVLGQAYRFCNGQLHAISEDDYGTAIK